MTKFTIQAETFIRLAKASVPFGSDYRPSLQSVRLEYRGGKFFALASTSFFLAVEYLGPTDQPNAAINVKTIPALMAWLASANELVINDGWANVDGAPYWENVAGPDDEPKFRDWPSLFPKAETDDGFLFVETDHMNLLGLSSPSGKLIFPKKISRTVPTIVRDADSPEWAGLFLAIDKLQNSPLPATYPEWLL